MKEEAPKELEAFLQFFHSELSENARDVALMMLLLHEGNLAHGLALTELDLEDFLAGVAELVEANIIETARIEDQTRFQLQKVYIEALLEIAGWPPNKDSENAPTLGEILSRFIEDSED